MALHNEFGKAGENAAKETLIKYGYTIRETNWKCGKLEIDIVAEKDGRIIIVEVKTRSSDYVAPVNAIDKRKISHLVKAANAYIKHYDLPHEVQFDIITLVGKPEDFTIEHIADAFMPPLKTYNNV